MALVGAMGALSALAFAVPMAGTSFELHLPAVQPIALSLVFGGAAALAIELVWRTGQRRNSPRQPLQGCTTMKNKRLVSVVVSLALLGAMVWLVLPELPDFSEVWGYVRAMTGVEVAILVAVAVWNLATYWVATRAASPALTWRQAIVMKTSATAVSNAVPGGSAVAVGLIAVVPGADLPGPDRPGRAHLRVLAPEHLVATGLSAGDADRRRRR